MKFTDNQKRIIYGALCSNSNTAWVAWQDAINRLAPETVIEALKADVNLAEEAVQIWDSEHTASS